MRRALVTAAIVLLYFVPTLKASAQSGNASVAGFVQDTSQAFIPGVTVTATNTQTGVVTTVITNESGTYNIPSLLPGTYKLSAELPGFKTQVINDVQLGQGASARYNFTLQVGVVADSVEVTAQATALITESSSTIGQVLAERQVRDLPLVSNNVLDLMQTMAGVRGATLGEATTFAGISTGMVNTVRDGLSVQNGRYANGVGATTEIHPDMVAEFRVILTPVDAEMGRGNGQVQILTRSGTNQLRGSGAWFIRNSALDANSWQNNKQVVNGVWKPGEATWINRNELTGSVGGPIVKNKTYSLQVQGTLRPTQGLSVQGTYIWSRSLETPLVGAALGSGLNTVPLFTNPVERNKDYALSPNHVTHDFRSYGTFELPAGPGRLLFRNSSGVLARLVEGWQTSFIINLNTGQPASLSATYLNGITTSPTGLYAASAPDVVGAFPSKGFGKVEWNGDFGTFFGSRFPRVPDPQCATVATDLKSYCTIQAVTDAKTGEILLQNPTPGKRGTLGRQTMELPGSWAFDAALSKMVKITESKSLQIRMDATNVFNHPVPANPILNINGNTPFGSIQEKGDQRRFFKGSVRLNF